MAMGGVAWMKGLFGLPAHTSWLFFLGLAGVLFTMIAWWRDVVNEANAGDHTPVVSIGLRYGMILFIASEVMFFVAWFWIFFEMALFHHHRTLSSIEEVRTAWATGRPHGVETVPAFQLPLVNTLTLLLSGTTVTWAHHALQVGDRKGARNGLILTVLLGVMFTAIQAYEYSHIFQHKYFFSEEAANAGLYGSSFIMATGFHGFHVLIGTIFLAVCLIRLMGGGFTPAEAFRLRGGGLVLALRGRGLALPVRLRLRDIRSRRRALDEAGPILCCLGRPGAAPTAGRAISSRAS